MLSLAALAATTAGFASNFDGMQLVDQDGRRFAANRLDGRITLVNFVYTGCSTVCPVQTQALAALQRGLPTALRGRVQLLSVSLDPLQDTPAALKDFARRRGADFTNWSFVTGRPQDIERLAATLQLYGGKPQARQPEDHSASLWLVDTQGRLVQRYAGNPIDAPRIARELQQLDAMAGTPGAR